MVNIFPKFTKTNFTLAFFEKSSIHPFYRKILNKSNGELLVNKKFQQKHYDGFFEIKLIPSYLQPYYTDLVSYMKVIRIYRTKGYLVNLDGFTSVDQYLTKKMKPKKRSFVRNRVRRLENCFNIKYKIFLGEINKTEYDHIFERFKILIKKRFEQRGDIHQSIKNWGFYKKTTYQLILDKKASLFIIYDGDKPIDICLNYHFQNIVNHAIRAYDIDYAKFSLGNIDIYKQLEWCFENNYKIFDFMWGDLEYKERWCNEIYLYEHHLFYNRNLFLGYPISHLMVTLYKLKDNFMIKIGNPFMQQIKALLKKIQTHAPDNVIHSVKVLNIPYNLDYEYLTKIDISKEEYSFLRKPTYDFQFSNSESSENVEVFKIINENESYIILGKKCGQKLIFK